MSTKVKIIVVCAIVLVLGICLFFIQHQRNELAKLKAQNSELIKQKELADGTVRSLSSYASKQDVERLIKDSGINFSDLKKDLRDMGSDIKGVQTIVANSKGFNASNIKSSSSDRGKNEDGTEVKIPTVECNGKTLECPDTYGYLTNRQALKLQEPFSDKELPVGEVGFSSWKEKPWDVNIYPRQYTVTTVIATNKDGKANYYNKLSVKSNGEEVVIPIDSSHVVETYPKPKFMFNPRLYLGADTGIIFYAFDGTPVSLGEVSPNLQLALFSLGKTKLDVDYTFLGLGAGYGVLNQSFVFMVSPVNYNIGKPIPFIENLFLGPTVTLDTQGQLGIMLGLRVGL